MGGGAPLIPCARIKTPLTFDPPGPAESTRLLGTVKKTCLTFQILEPRNEDIPISAEQLCNPLGTNSNTSKQILKIRSSTEPTTLNWLGQPPTLSQQSEQQSIQQNSTLYNLLTQNSNAQQLSAEDNNIIEEFLNYELQDGSSPESTGQDSRRLSIPTTLSLGTI